MLRNLSFLSLLLFASPLAAQVELTGQFGDATYQLGGSLTTRGEVRRDTQYGSPALSESNDFIARAALDFNIDFDEYFNAFVNIYAGEEDDYSSGDAGITELYLDMHKLLGDYSVRLGRQQFDLGDGRLVSSAPWRFEQNSFDAIRVSSVFNSQPWQVWHSRAALGPTNLLADNFSGLFADFGMGQDSNIETFVLRRAEGSRDLEEMTFAVRWYGQTTNGLEWSAFAAVQDGEDGAREILAPAFAITLRKRLDMGHGIGVELAFANGNDGKAADRKRYSPVYIDQHRFNGRADVIAFSNVIDLAILYWLDWNERWSFHVDAHSFSRQSNSDNVYLGHDVAAVTPASTSNAIGYELDAYCEGVISDHLSMDFGAAMFSPLASLPSDEEQFYLFLQLVFNF
ncbi:MAG: alginate export family protein [Planctomycetota bacterium]|jgi:hypothetical protein|nr:alginate export family protein [Planctomycetota bacterium]